MNRGRSILAWAVAIIVLSVQVRNVITTYASYQFERVLQLRNMPAWQRSALMQGGDIGYYIEFLNAHIPEDARVILPPRLPPRPVAHVGFMQYYLFPRDIHNCGMNEVDECIRRVSGSNTFILAVPGFPPRELAEQTKDFIRFRDNYGLFAPRGGQP